MTPRRAFTTFLLGMILVQTAWILAVPAFRGIDEFDHVYRAEAVARGQMLPDPAPPDGSGELVTIPGDVVRAASKVCDSYVYTKRGNCHAFEIKDSGLVTVADRAARYNPTYYAVVGMVARMFHGKAVDYAIRIATALMCSLLIAWAASLVSTWSRTNAALLALAVSLMPTLVYSTSLASPNGVGYAGAVLVWTALIGLGRSARPQAPIGLLAAVVVGSLALVSTHTTGPMWLALILFVMCWLYPSRRWLRVVARHRRAHALAAGLVVAATGACAAWTLLSGANAPGGPIGGSGGAAPSFLPYLVSSEILWPLQAIAAFPLRDDPASPIVYGLWLVPTIGILVAAARAAPARARICGGLLVGFLIVVPAVLTALAFSYAGLAWQGRYSFPLIVGVFVLGGATLSDSGRWARPREIVAAVVLLGSSMAISIVQLAHHEAVAGPSKPATSGIPGGLAVVAVLSFIGIAIPLISMISRANVEAPGPHGDNEPSDVLAASVPG